MAEEIKPEVIKKTQNSLGKYIKKPPLTEKLLRKPPFRFIHDIISAVIKETGFLENLFTADELHSDHLNKEEKLAFLVKLINVVSVELTVRPVKIVCGQEPTKTNQLLQTIAAALDKNVSSTEAVEHYKKSARKNSGRFPQSNSNKHGAVQVADAKPSVKGKEVSDERRKIPKSTRVSRPGTVSSTAASKQSAETSTAIETNDKLSQMKIQTAKVKNVSNEPSIPSKISTDIATLDESEGNKTRLRKLDGNHELESCDSSELAMPLQLVNQNTIDKSDVEKPNTDADQITEYDEASGTKLSTTSSYQDAELLKNQTETTVPRVIDQPETTYKHHSRPASRRPTSARPAAPKVRWQLESVNTSQKDLMEKRTSILDGFNAPDDDIEDSFVVGLDLPDHPKTNEVEQYKNSITDQEHGFLVSQILETQRDLVKIATSDQDVYNGDEQLEVGSVNVQQTTVQEIAFLRGKIQPLTRSTNPMGNLLDLWQEDFELMQQEFFDWEGAFQQAYHELKIEKKSANIWATGNTEDFSEIEAAINHELDEIYNAKLKITASNRKTQQLLEVRAYNKHKNDFLIKF